MTSTFVAYGSTVEKAASRALGGGSAAEAHQVIPISGCMCTAVAHDGKLHVMSVSLPASSGVPQHYCAFATSGERDSFMRAVQTKSAAGETLVKVNPSPSHLAAAQLASNAAACNPSIVP